MKIILGTVILLSVLLGISYYLAYRLFRGFRVFFPRIKFWPLVVVIGSIVSLILLGFAQAIFRYPASVKHILELFSGYTMGLVLYLLLFTLLADFIFCVPRLLKFSFIKHRLFEGFVTFGILLLTVSVYFYGLINAQQIKNVYYDVKIEGKTDVSDINLLLITDLHLGAVGSEERLSEIVDEINALSPDVVCISGDFFDTDFYSIKNPEKAINTIRNINSTYGVHACLGNHDGGKSFEKMTEFLNKANINLLNDEFVVIDNRMVLVGRIDDAPIGGCNNLKRTAFADILIDADPSLSVVLLDHKPSNISEYGREVDLVLSGHTHKGQVFPANLITDIMYDVDYGYYRKDQNSPQVIVSSGVGTWGMPMRVGSDNEIVSVRFICK